MVDACADGGGGGKRNVLGVVSAPVAGCVGDPRNVMNTV